MNLRSLIKEAVSKLAKQSSQSNEDVFDGLAKMILCKGLLLVGDEKFCFKEVEFYCNNNKGDFDPYAHKHDKEYPTASIRPHYSGIDVSIREGDVFGGILIRGIRRLEARDDEKGNYGPLLSLFEILSEINDIEKETTFKVVFQEENHSPEIKIYSTQRWGLSDKIEGKGYYEIGWRYHSYAKDPKSQPIKSHK